MHPRGYSDRISHAFAFAAKHYAARARRGSGLTYLTHPANLAVILARYGCDEVTIQAAILHHLLEENGASDRDALEIKIGEKFGSVVLSLVKDVLEPRYDPRGAERPWDAYKLDYLARLGTVTHRALDICAADEIHLCGSIIADVRRLGVEYLATFSKASPAQLLWWHQAVTDALATHTEWPRREMLEELRLLAAHLRTELETEA